MKNNVFSAKLKRIIVLAVILVVAIALAILAIQIVNQLKSQNESEAEGSQSQSTPGKPARVNIFGIGEVCGNVDSLPHYGTIVFNNVYLTDEIKGQTGRFLVFNGNINTAKFSFNTKKYLRVCITITDIDYFDNFEYELSESISDIDLLIDGEKGEMNGEFCLVFSIDETNYNSIKNKSSQIFIHTIGQQISLDAGIYWPDSGSFFNFSTTDVQYVESIN